MIPPNICIPLYLYAFMKITAATFHKTFSPLTISHNKPIIPYCLSSARHFLALLLFPLSIDNIEQDTTSLSNLALMTSQIIPLCQYR
mmetsp:Transcript_46128/g.96864  ORF Transcript_46128/g.96864 Transcript_46128/m.96864 type:complete len:87 (-) Transcript_46128:122-382(-)